jgi:imidazolonepropionase-like amidohydrolase
MKVSRRDFLRVSAAAAPLGIAAVGSGADSAAAGPLALLPDRVWDGHADRAAEGRAVLVEGERIKAICTAGELPADVRRLPLNGCTLLPGLIDAHVHATFWSLPAFLAAGVTTVRDVGNVLDWILAARDRARDNPTQSPRIVCCGPLLDGADPYWPIIGKSHADIAAMESAVKVLIERGVDAVKLYVRITPEQMAAAVRVAKRHGMHVLAHLGGITPLQAAQMGVDEIEHLAGCPVAWRPATVEERGAFIDELLPHGLVMCPTIIVWERFSRIEDASLRRDRALAWVPKTFAAFWHRSARRFASAPSRLESQRVIVEMKACLNQMRESGLPVIAGTDTPFEYIVPGFSLHDELAMMVDAGFPPAAALRTATSESARILRISDQVGSIAAGMNADLLAVHGNPLTDILDLGNVGFVMRQGRAVNMAALEAAAATMRDVEPDDPISKALPIEDARRQRAFEPASREE